MIRYIVFFIAPALLLLFSCGKEYPCKDRELALALVGFDSTELKQIKVVASLNKKPIDSAVFRDSQLYYYVKYDTAYFPYFRNLKVASESVLSKKYEWEITVLKTGKSVLISNIQHEQKTKKCGGIFSLDCFTCYNPIVSVNVNGISQKPGQIGTVYLYK
jgi:hypothetical protein